MGPRAATSRSRRTAGGDELPPSEEVQRQFAPQSAPNAQELVHPVFPDSTIARGGAACARLRDDQADAARERGAEVGLQRRGSQALSRRVSQSILDNRRLKLLSRAVSRERP